MALAIADLKAVNNTRCIKGNRAGRKQVRADLSFRKNYLYQFDFLTARQQYIALFIIALLLLRIPRIGRFFRVVNTMYHEDGHALMALLTSGSVEKIDLFADTSGSCVYRPKNKFAAFLVCLAGYPFSSLSAAAMFWCLHYNHYEWFLYGFSVTLVINLLLWVRNQYGIFWILFMGLMTGLCFYIENNYLTYYFLFFIAALNLVESVYSTLVILYISAENPSDSGDARSLRQHTYIPAIVWALFFVAVSAYAGVWVVEMLFGMRII